MRKIIAHEWMSLDGVVQAPSYADEDPDGGFAYGGINAQSAPGHPPEPTDY